VLGELGRERRDLLVQSERLGVSGIRLVRDRREQAKAVRPEQRSPRRAHEPSREVERRHPRAPPMLQRLAEKAEIVARSKLELLGKASVKLPSRVGRQVRQGGLAKQIVRQTRRPAGFDGDPPADQLADRGVETAGLPVEERSRLGDGHRAPRDRQQRQQRPRVGAGPAEANGQELRQAARRATRAGERLEPEGRPASCLPEPGGASAIDAGFDRDRKLDPLLERQRRQLDHRDAAVRQRVCERVAPLAEPAGGEDRNWLARLASTADQVVAERVRELVHPLQIVDDEQRVLERAESTMGSLEQAHRLQRSRLLGTEQDRLQAHTVARHLGQSSEQRSRGRERNGALGLIADDRHGLSRRHAVLRLREQPALPTSRLADHDRGGRAAPRGADHLGQRSELAGPTDEHAHLGPKSKAR
jgi:hypothetical protein